MYMAVRAAVLYCSVQLCSSYLCSNADQETVPSRDALEGKAPQRQPQKPLDRPLEEVAKAAGGGYCRLQMPLKVALAITAAGHRLGALEEGGLPPPLQCMPGPQSIPDHTPWLAAKDSRDTAHM